MVCEFLDSSGDLSVGACELGVGGGEFRDGLGERVKIFVLLHRHHGQLVKGLAEILLHFLADEALRVGSSDDGVCGESGLAGSQLVDSIHVVECVAEQYIGGLPPATVEWFCLPL